jgi:7-carboxy-7-deazaguanine synthase
MSTLVNHLRITETFFSLQGESSLVGYPTFFIRLTGCPLRCAYCDTAYAFQGGKLMSVEALVAEAQASGTRFVCVTGGEPLAQPECLPLLSALCDAGFSVSLETSGALPVNAVDRRVIKIMDIKTPDSGEMEKNLWSNLDWLSSQDEIKFVIGSRADYDWSKNFFQQHPALQQVKQVLFSPSAQRVKPDQLAQWILEDKLPVRFQLQLHKIIWGDRQGV